jgi:hypothetical protein
LHIEFTPPGVPIVQTTDAQIFEKYNSATGIASKFSMSFIGGNKSEAAGATFFQGTMTHTGKSTTREPLIIASGRRAVK